MQFCVYFKNIFKKIKTCSYRVLVAYKKTIKHRCLLCDFVETEIDSIEPIARTVIRCTHRNE